MTVLLIACGTSTLKSPLLRAFFTPHVHSRLRKRLSRCTLDCGFKTPESPALRGFVAERCPITGTSLYLVLKSNGLHRPENLPVKFGFSPKSTSTNIAKKLPLQRCFKPLLIALFNFSHKRPTFAFTSESGYTLGFRRKIAHKGTHGETGAFRMGVVSLPSERSARSRTSPGRVSERRTLPLLGLGRGCSQRTQKAFGTAMRLCASLFRGVAAPLGCVIFFISDEIVACMTCSRNFFRFSRRSSLCCSCASCVSARSFSVLVFARKTTGDYFSRTPISARSWSRGLGFAIVLDLLF